MSKPDVLIVGAGPTGLVLALWLTAQGIPVRIIDKKSEPGSTSRALAVQARTLELYRQLDLADAVVAAGTRNPAVNLWIGGKRRVHVTFGQIGGELTPYPYVLIYPQDMHERLLAERLATMGVSVERETELTSFTQEGDHIIAQLRRANGDEKTCEACFLAGCDGAGSLVRHLLGTGFEGGTYDQTFYVADVAAHGRAVNGEVHVAFERSDFVALFSYGEGGRARLVGAIRDERESAETLTFEDIGHRAIESLGLTIDKVNWFSTYRVHHRVASHYRTGRAFLVGDAAHVHSPVGGQGMNTGIGDAINLAWKLAAVLKRKAPESLLDSYEAERLPFARRLVATTDRVFSFVTTEGPIADFIRMNIVPAIAGLGSEVGGVRRFLFRTVSQLGISYPHSPLSAGRAGDIKGGDRMPWVRWAGGDNFAALGAIAWQVHVYGEARGELSDWCRKSKVPLNDYPWRPEHADAGLERDAAYLVRPDGYVGLADSGGRASSISGYFAERGLSA
ncbi:FAD-dependent monooxygenase [Pseudaminobacter sp. 19-2017]|uniref:FAD-dependent monooxygenase n=1 Tax=Pseudaminobacter soli (ex Zhang et al. 2022) TaxID=2831468 RepID=A0A942DYJ5_9HYPH|nr:FAD-dependent monooxygenase [Pseudaminobacter soli]MBS3647858.1 FAD-dependent monooxygenase [Pseudaminobacter soli]